MMCDDSFLYVVNKSLSTNATCLDSVPLPVSCFLFGTFVWDALIAAR